MLITLCSAAQWPADSVYNRAKSGVEVEWTPSAANTDPWFFTTYGTTCTGANEIYLQCDFKAGTTYKSIAYSYGGEDNAKEFSDKLSRDFLVGSHLCHYQSYGDPSDTIAGTDCSGFLSYCWNVHRQSTSMFINNKSYLHIDRDSLQAGDALVKASSHAVLVLDASIPEATLIVESTSAVNGVRKRLIDVNSEYWLKYVPLRNPAIEGTMSILPHKSFKGITPFSVQQGVLHFENTISSLTLRNLKGQVLYQGEMIQKLQLPNTKGLYLIEFTHGGLRRIIKVMNR